MPKPTAAELAAYAEETARLAGFRRAQADLYDNTAREAAAGITHETDEDTRLQQAVIDAGKELPKRYRHLRKGV
jgi:hypothetical protein